MDYRLDGTKIDLHPERVAAWLRGESVAPLYLEIAPAGGCNHRCTFCAVDYLGYERRFLPFDIVLERLHEMGAMGVKSIMWAGEGEPLLHKALATFIRRGHEAGIDQAITTNGIALTEPFCREAFPHLAWIKVSINAGWGDDYVRIHQTSLADWDRLWVNLDRAVLIREQLGASVTLGVQMVVLPENIAHASDLALRCYMSGLDYLVLKPYSHHPKSLTRRYKDMAYADLFAAAEEVARTAQGIQVIVRHDTAARVQRAREYDRCYATPHFWAYVMATGDVYACSAYLGDERFRLGNLIEQSFAEIWTGPAKQACQQLVDEQLDISECRKSCRMDHANVYLHRLRNPEPHDAFI